MHSVDFPGSNLDLNKPASMTDEQCSSCRAFTAVDGDGFPFILTAWRPSKEDLDALIAGEPLYMKTLGTGFTPVCFFTLDEKGVANV